MKFILVLSIALTCAATPGAAAIIDYECALKEQGDSGWIADRLILQHDAGRGKVLVVDPVILTMGPDPVAGKLVTDGGDQISFGWDVKSPRDRNGTVAPAMVYRMTIAKTSGTAVIQARPTGFDEVFSGKGKCQVSGG